MKYKIVIIGAGRISYSLASALIRAKYSIISVISKNEKSAGTLAGKFNIKHFSDKLNDIPKSANMFLLSVPDSEIEGVAKLFSKQKIDFSKSCFIHFSGSVDIKPLNVLKRKGAVTASLHLMNSFPSKRIVKLNNIAAAIETDDKNYKLLESFANSLKLSTFKINPGFKSYYHIAGVFSLNFLAGNLYTAREMLTLNKLDESEFLKHLGKSINLILKNSKSIGPANALSGPVDRGEIETIKAHIKSIKTLTKNSNGNYFSLMLKNYIIQSLHLLYLVKEKHHNWNKKHLAIKEFLAGELKRIEESE